MKGYRISIDYPCDKLGAAEVFVEADSLEKGLEVARRACIEDVEEHVMYMGSQIPDKHKRRDQNSCICGYYVGVADPPTIEPYERDYYINQGSDY